MDQPNNDGIIDNYNNNNRNNHDWDVLTALEVLYPTSGLDQRIALSRKDGYWPFIQRGVDPPKEYVYGEFDIPFFAQVLQYVGMKYQNTHTDSNNTKNNDNNYSYESFSSSISSSSSSSPWRDKVFCDIGSGTGRLVVAAAALHPWKLCRGIELLDGIHQEATTIVQKCCAIEKTGQHQPPPFPATTTTTASSKLFTTSNAVLTVPSTSVDNDSDTATIATISTNDDRKRRRGTIPLSPMELKCGSFTDPYEFYGDSDLIFVFSSCMDPTILTQLAQSIGRQCQAGCIVLTTEYTLPLGGTGGGGGDDVYYIEPLPDDPTYPHGRYSFELLESITGPNVATGGESTVHIHRVIHGLGSGCPHPKPLLSVSDQAYRAVLYANDIQTNNVDTFVRLIVNQMAFIGLPESWWNNQNKNKSIDNIDYTSTTVNRGDVPLKGSKRNKIWLI
jgi:hypothetical protein